MIADSTSASSGLMTSSRSASVLEGVICSRGISSPVAGSRYWMRLWWDSSVSSSIRMPVCRRTSTIAQHQNPRCSSKVRSRRLPVAGSSAQIRPVVSVFIIALRSVWPPAVNGAPAVVPGGGLQPLSGGGALGVGPGGQGGQDRQPFAGPLVHPGLALGPVFLVGGIAGADRAADGMRAPAGRVIIGPFGDVEVEGPDCGQHAAAIQPGGHCLDAAAIGGGRGLGPGHHPLFPRGGDVARELQGGDAGMVGLQIGPEQLAEQVGEILQRGEIRRRLALAQVIDQHVADRLALDVVAVDQLLARRLPAAGEHPHRRRRVLGRTRPRHAAAGRRTGCWNAGLPRCASGRRSPATARSPRQ